MVIFKTVAQALSAGDQQVMVGFYEFFGLPDQGIRTTQDVLNRSHALIGRTDWLDAKENLSDADCEAIADWAQPYENNWAKHEDIDYLNNIDLPVFGQTIDALEGVVERLTAVLSRQTDYVHTHTDILVHALHWQTNQKATQHLLVGKERIAAEEWLLTEFIPPAQPPCQPSALVCEFICEARKNAENLMTDIFICASTADLPVRNQLLQLLSRHAKTIWTHDRDIQKGSDYGRAINIGIETANNFMFVISKASVASEHCQRELAYALQYHKRIIPLLIAPMPNEEIPDELQDLQSIDFTENHRNTGLDEILTILRQEHEYYQWHKLLLVRALKWTAEAQKTAFLLRGHNLENAKTWLQLNQKREPYPPLTLHHQLITASETAKGQLGTEVFISYSRTDGDFARKLNTALQQAGLTCWFDQESISTGADFEQEIFKGIDSADNFVFVLSPEAVASEYCEREVNHAAERGKRMMTVLHRATEPNTMPAVLRAIQWLDFSNTEFDKAFWELVQALDQQKAYIRTHTEILAQARKWQKNQKAAQHLLVGQQRVAAEAWLLTEFLGGKQPPCQPATLMCEFICEARKQAEDRMTDIFLCYAPKETDLCHQVVQSLSRHAKTCWTYDSDIQTGSQSERAIEQGIEGADNFGLFLSPVISESRRHELAYALKYNKRIIPLLVAPTAAEQIPNALRGLQRIDLTETHRAAGFETLLRILRNEHAYYERHKVLLVRALKWIEGNHKPMFLLRGYNLETAKVWLQINQNRPGQPPLPLHQTLITASETAISDQSGTQVYISYSRQDNDFVRQLNTRLQEAGKSTWFDQENQTKNTNADVDFEAEAFKSIASADNLVLVLSPASAASNYCQREIKQAAELGKRIITVLCRETDANTIPNALQSLPWLDFNRSDFDQAFLALVEILERQTDYVRRHTDILVQALHWQQNQRATQHLLVGKQRQAAEQWLKTEFLGGKQPPCQPTALMCEYICQARKNAENLMTDIFICYDEQDKAIRNQVIQSLSRYAKTCWTHVSDIQKGANYERAIEQGIENADNFCYFISPYAVASDYCQRELNHALQYNKRVVPLLIAPTPASAFPEALQGLQYIDLTDNTCQADYDSDIDDILNILKHEQDYYKQHKVLQVLALKWATENRNPAFLLRGHNLENAQIWLRLSNKRQQHPPLELHHQLITASEAAKGQLGTEVFISYSRKDGDFARHLNTVLQEAGKTTWFDQVSISTGVDFEKKIYKGIDGADNFVFVISPDAVQSEYCKREVNYAADNSKRFISVLHRETSPDTMPLALRKIHWIDFKDTTFDKSCRKLIQAIELDREHVHQHTMLQQRAHDWAENNRSADFLLNITACANAESWQTTAQNKLPAPTVLQLDFIENSRQAIKANKWRKALMILTTVSMIAAVILAVVAVVQMNEADVERQKANVERENAKQAEKTAEKQTRLAEQERLKANVEREKAKQAEKTAEKQARFAEQERLKANVERENAKLAEKTAEEQTRFAEQERLKANVEREKAKQAQATAEEQTRLAEQERENAKQAQATAEKQTRLAEQERLKANVEREKVKQAQATAEEQTRFAEHERLKANVEREKAKLAEKTAEEQTRFAELEREKADVEREKVKQAQATAEEQTRLAEQERQKANVEREKAKLAEKTAEEQTRLAEHEREKANVEREKVKQAQATAEKQTLLAEQERQKANVERENAKQAEKTAEKQTLLAEQERQKANVCEKAKPEPTKAGRVFQNALKDGGLGPEMIWLPAGKFRMGDIQGGGDDDEKPVHEVSIGRFAMSRYEVTFDEYDRFAEATSRNKPRDRGWGRGKRPVISVFWHDAVDYVKWLSEQTQKPYRLPSEAEWEYAARAGTDTKYYWGNQSGVNFGHFRGSGSEWSVQQTAPVGSFAPNDFGIYDTVGNVWEWVADPWHSSYDNAPSDGSVWKGEGDFRVLRGGSFNDFSFSCRAAYRGRNTSGLRSCDLGFRVAVGVVAWTE